MRTLLVLLVLLAIAGVWVFERDLPASLVDSKYSNVASQFFPLTNGTRLHYRDQGNPDGPVVVLLHGSNASLHTWEPWVSELADTYRLITLDLPGHGLTGRVPDDRYDTAAFISSISELMRGLQINRFVLGGNSMGGSATWRYALQHPEQVTAMLLINASGPQSWREARAGTTSGTPLAFRMLDQSWFRAVANYVDLEYLVGEGLRTAHFQGQQVDEALIQRYYHLNMRDGTRQATLLRFATPRPPVDEATLSTLSMPTLVMWGREDSLIPFTIGERFALTLPHAQLIVYEKVGHVPMEEIPQRSASDVRAFLTALNAGN